MTTESLVQKLPMKHGKAAVVDPTLPWFFDNAGRLTQDAARAVGMTVLYPAVQRKFSAEVLEFVDNQQQTYVVKNNPEDGRLCLFRLEYP